MIAAHSDERKKQTLFSRLAIRLDGCEVWVSIHSAEGSAYIRDYLGLNDPVDYIVAGVPMLRKIGRVSWDHNQVFHLQVYV